MRHFLPYLFLIPIVFLMIINTAHAGLYLGYADSDYHFEVYSGNSYVYAATPYTYTYDNYYYYNSPYRVYSQGTYHYFQPGWYGYDDAWRFAPDDCISCYTYYPTD